VLELVQLGSALVMWGKVLDAAREVGRREALENAPSAVFG
jgi:hypothetical protein